MKRAIHLTLAVLAMLLVLGSFAAMPTGANEMVLPGPDKTFEQFQLDDSFCRQWAAQNGLPSPGIASQQTIQSAVMGTFWGAGLGAAIGAIAGNPGLGAAIGAGSGLILGTVSGVDDGRLSGYEAQRRYYTAYQQCMSAKGNQIPGVVVKEPRINRKPPPPPGAGSSMDSYDPPYPYPSRN